VSANGMVRAVRTVAMASSRRGARNPVMSWGGNEIDSPSAAARPIFESRAPQHQSAPSADAIAQPVLPPSATDETGGNPSMRVGTASLASAAGRPSWPYSFRPQQYTEPRRGRRALERRDDTAATKRAVSLRLAFVRGRLRSRPRVASPAADGAVLQEPADVLARVAADGDVTRLRRAGDREP